MQKNKILKIILLVVSLILCLLVLFYIAFTNIYRQDYKNIIEQTLQEITINNSSLNTNLVLSIIKQESKFNSTAKSSKDAFGLMQLTFSTAKEVASKLSLNISIEDLYNPEINIKLGVNYLNYLFTIFDDKQLVILSYNAGFNKVKTWLNNNELTIENGIYQTPYKETNIYVKKVLQNEKIYNLIKG